MKRTKALAALAVALLFLSACGPKEAAVTPTPSPTPLPPPVQETPTAAPTPSPSLKSEPIPDPVCILEGEEIVSLCGSVGYSAMVTADGRLLALGDFPFDREKCVLLRDNGVYELPLQNITGAWLGYDAMLALDRDGVLWGLGSNAHGQLWDAPAEALDAPAKVNDHVVSAVIGEWHWSSRLKDSDKVLSERWDYSAALKDDGSVWLAGSGTNMDGEEISLPPTQISGDTKDIYNRGNSIFVQGKTDGAWRYLGDAKELLSDPTDVENREHRDQFVDWGYYLTDDDVLYYISPHGDTRTLLADVADVDLNLDSRCDHYSTAVTKNGDLHLCWETAAEEEGWVTFEGPTKVMEGVKLARPCGSGVMVVTKSDGTVWAIRAETLSAALDSGTLITLPEGRF